VIFDLIKK